MDEIARMFQDITPEQFFRDTSANHTRTTAIPPNRFDLFLDTMLKMSIANIEAGDDVPLVVLHRLDEQRVFLPDPDETIEMFIDRLAREAQDFHAWWVFGVITGAITEPGILSAMDGLTNEQRSDLLHDLIARGTCTAGPTWYAESRKPERIIRFGILDVEQHQIVEGRSGDGSPDPLWARILVDVTD